VNPLPHEKESGTGTLSGILVTGGNGFLGRAVIRALRRHEAQGIYSPSREEFDLMSGQAIDRMFEAYRPAMVIHLAAVVGGIGANQKKPGAFFYENALMGLQLMEAARRHRVGKFVAVGTICSYPKLTSVPFREEEFWNGYPEETNAPYGLAKKMLLVQAQAYRAQYGFNAIYLLPANLYGPGDNFDPDTSHVIPALIRKCFEAIKAGSSEIIVWGDGSATREFLFVDDAAEGIVLASQHYEKTEPVNLGTGQEISVKDLSQLIANLTGFGGRIVWDTTRPNGQPRRSLDTSRAENEFGFKARTRLEDGLRLTIDEYRRGEQHHEGAGRLSKTHG
jgi:GDP-L-fucose synthase